MKTPPTAAGASAEVKCRHGISVFNGCADCKRLLASSGYDPLARFRRPDAVIGKDTAAAEILSQLAFAKLRSAREKLYEIRTDFESCRKGFGERYQEFAAENVRGLTATMEILDDAIAYSKQKSAPPSPTQTGEERVCPCGLATCVESWEPGCGLGTREEFARRVTEDDATVRVPREPTEAMIHQGAASHDHPSVYMGGPSESGKRMAKRIWAAMIAAAESGE